MRNGPHGPASFQPRGSIGRMPPPLIYNLFPTLVGPPRDWLPHADRARAMGFDHLYLNPVQYPGFSGSLYAVKDHGRLHPELVPAGGDDRLEALAPTVRALREAGLRVMMDLVINHTARDSALVTEHPGWYRRDAAGEVVSPHAIDPDDSLPVRLEQRRVSNLVVLIAPNRHLSVQLHETMFDHRAELALDAKQEARDAVRIVQDIASRPHFTATVAHEGRVRREQRDHCVLVVGRECIEKLLQQRRLLFGWRRESRPGP